MNFYSTAISNNTSNDLEIREQFNHDHMAIGYVEQMVTHLQNLLNQLENRNMQLAVQEAMGILETVQGIQAMGIDTPTPPSIDELDESDMEPEAIAKGYMALNKVKEEAKELRARVNQKWKNYVFH